MHNNGHNFKRNTEVLSGMSNFNAMKSLHSQRVTEYNMMLNNINIDNIYGESKISNKQFKQMLVSLAMAKATVKTAYSCQSPNSADIYYREEFYNYITKYIIDMLKSDRPSITSSEISSIINEAQQYKGKQIYINAEVFLAKINDGRNGAISHAKSLSNKHKDSWMITKVEALLKNNTKNLPTLINKVKKAKKTYVPKPKSAFSVAFSSFVANAKGKMKKYIEKAEKKLPSARKVRRGIKNSLKVLGKTTLLALGPVLFYAGFLSKNEGFKPASKPKKPTTDNIKWQKVSNIETKDTISFEDAQKLVVVDDTKTNIEDKSSQIKDSQRILNLWVENDNLSKVLKGLESQGLSKEDALTYAHLAALCGSTTPDNIVFGDGTSSNGNHNMFGAANMKKAGITKVQRDLFAKSVDFINGKTNVSKEAINIFKTKLKKTLGKKGKLNFSKEAEILLALKRGKSI